MIKKGSITYNNIENLTIVLFIAVVLGTLVNRLVRGIDFTDESFYVAMAYRMAKGSKFLVDMWEQCSTSALLPSILMRIYVFLIGNKGIVLFYRVAFLVVNGIASLLLFTVCKEALDRNKALLVTLAYLVYAPFHFYIFSYNNCADMFLMLMVSAWLLYAWRKQKKWLCVSGIMCALLVLTYPTMILLCVIMVGLVLIKERKNGLFFVGGGLFAAAFLVLLIISQVGISGIKAGIDGILSDPAYSLQSIPFSRKLMEGLFTYLSPVFEVHRKLWVFYCWVVVLYFLRKKFPLLKLSLVFYPFVVFLDVYFHPYATYSYGNLIFYTAFLAPVLILFTTNHKKLFQDLLLHIWVPSFCFYLIIAMSSAGGGGQGAQGFVLVALMTLIEIACITEETLLDWKKDLPRELAKIPATIMIALFIVFEIAVFYHVVYRETPVNTLTAKVENGPYAGLYTSKARKDFIDETTGQMERLQEPGKTALVLYHANFSYLMLDMKPLTPTMWGLYPHINNERVFIKYFYEHSEIPEYIYILNMPDEYSLDAQKEEFYTHAVNINELIEKAYVLEDNVPIGAGNIEKYRVNKRYDEVKGKLAEVLSSY